MRFQYKLLVTAILMTGAASTQAQIYKVTLNGASENPPVTSNGTGTSSVYVPPMGTTTASGTMTVEVMTMSITTAADTVVDACCGPRCPWPDT